MATRRQTILITGASSGLGAGMAREFAARGRTLALCARRVDRLEALRDELVARHGVRVELRALDVNEHQRVFEVFEELVGALGTIDRFVINAGSGAGRRVGKGHFHDNVKAIQTNLVAGLAQCEAAVCILRRQNAGHLVVISSMTAFRGLPKHLTAYAASKAGLSALAEGIRAELGATPIRVTTICPGYIRTEMNEGARHLPFAVDGATGSRALVKAIEREPALACVPAWPWALMRPFIRLVPGRFLL
jgi:hypothetical protein